MKKFIATEKLKEVSYILKRTQIMLPKEAFFFIFLFWPEPIKAKIPQGSRVNILAK